MHPLVYNTVTMVQIYCILKFFYMYYIYCPIANIWNSIKCITKELVKTFTWQRIHTSNSSIYNHYHILTIVLIDNPISMNRITTIRYNRSVRTIIHCSILVVTVFCLRLYWFYMVYKRIRRLLYCMVYERIGWWEHCRLLSCYWSLFDWTIRRSMAVQLRLLPLNPFL